MTLFHMAEMSTWQTLEIYQPELNKNCKAELSAIWKSVILMLLQLSFLSPYVFVTASRWLFTRCQQ